MTAPQSPRENAKLKSVADLKLRLKNYSIPLKDVLRIDAERPAVMIWEVKADEDTRQYINQLVLLDKGLLALAEAAHRGVKP